MTGEGVGENSTEDALFGGSLRLLQPGSGHRAGTDAVLLAAALPEDARRIVDLGAASGIVGLRAAQMNPEARVTLIERDSVPASLAARNITLNGLEERVVLRETDAMRLGQATDLREAFDCVLTNPPFLDGKKVRISADAGRARAHVIEGSLDEWLRAATTLLAPRGRIVMIHRADALSGILCAMEKRFGQVSLRFIHPEEGRGANRVLVGGIKGSRAPLAVLAPIILHETGAFTPHGARIHAGDVRIDMKTGGKTRPPRRP